MPRVDYQPLFQPDRPYFRRPRVWIAGTLALVAVLSFAGILTNALWHHNQRQVSLTMAANETHIQPLINTGDHTVFAATTIARTARQQAAPALLVSHAQQQALDQYERFIIIGDVHGCIDELNQLLESVRYTPGKDHVVFVGDLVAKGPKSYDVVERARELGASCVRGNHDQRLILAHVIQQHQYLLTPPFPPAALGGDSAPATAEGTDNPATWQEVNQLLPKGLQVNQEHRQLAQHLSTASLQYLLACPAMLPLPKQHRALVVHGGVDPAVPLAQQDPEVVMTIRNILPNGQPSSKKKKGVGWFEQWQTLQENKRREKNDSLRADQKQSTPAPPPSHPISMLGELVQSWRDKVSQWWAHFFHSTTAPATTAHATVDTSANAGPEDLDGQVDRIIYGHDAGRGLNLRHYTMGLDSRCVDGGELTALIVPGWETVSVQCTKRT
ncbi:hypothetical protein H4R35_006217, partial [Dimargaris xerosporica]